MAHVEKGNEDEYFQSRRCSERYPAHNQVENTEKVLLLLHHHDGHSKTPNGFPEKVDGVKRVSRVRRRSIFSTAFIFALDPRIRSVGIQWVLITIVLITTVILSLP